MAPIEGMPFLVHWLNNKETTFTSKAEKTQRGSFLPLSRHSSLMSFASSINEDMLQSWVCIEDTHPSPEHSSSDSESRKMPHVFSLEKYLNPSGTAAARGNAGSPHSQDVAASHQAASKKLFASLMDEWCNSPDLLLCIHPGTGSLMVWTVEGLDSAHTTSRLVHVSFSSCLPYVFPPHLAQSLHQGLLQYLIKEPDVVHTREMALIGSLADISIPVPQIRLPSGGTVTGSMADLAKHSKEDVPKTKADSSLILISSHQNGSIHAWSVELTVQSDYYTSIAGLIHWGGTGGHHLEVKAVHRHPWLPVLMTVSVETNSWEDSGEGSGNQRSSHVDNELIIWNAQLPGPLEHKSHLHELSRMASSSPLSFLHVAWIPPISVNNSMKEGVLARSPSTGLFVANVGNELRLFQTSLYFMSKPPAQNGVRSPCTSTPPPDVNITSHFGKEGIKSVGVVDKDISRFEEIVSLHSFRLCSLVTSHDIKESVNASFAKDIVIVLIENRRLQTSSNDPALNSKSSYLHVWRAFISTYEVASNVQKDAADVQQGSTFSYVHEQGYRAKVEKVFSSALPLPHGTHIKHSKPACDISSSLQLQLPTLSAPFLFTTACSDSTIRCWQLSAKYASDDAVEQNDGGGVTMANDLVNGVEKESSKPSNTLEFELHEVFVGASSSADKLSPSSGCSLNLCENEALTCLPKKSSIPCSISNAYAGRFALAHLLTHAPDSLQPSRYRHSSQPSLNPLGRYAAVTIWECESTGGLKWICEASLLLSGVGGVSPEAKAADMIVHLEWIPMENGAYLLATCFESIISIFGMALPQVEGDFTKLLSLQKRASLVSEKRLSADLTSESSKVSWVCLLQFPCAKRYPGLSITQFAYTGSNSLLISVGTEIHIYSCMVRGNKLEAYTPSIKERRAVSKNPSRVFRRKESPDGPVKLLDSDIINLLDYAHARNTPLPQYHPKILLELMNSGKLHAVKAILVNLVKYLLLYESKKAAEPDDVLALYDEKEERTENLRKRMISVSSDGQLRRSKRVGTKIEVQTIPSLSLSKFGISNKSTSSPDQQQNQEDGDAKEKATEDADDDALFDLTADVLTPKENFTFNFDEEEKTIDFTEIDPLVSEFDPMMSDKLTSILQYAQLADLSDMEQVRLMAIAETVANTKMAFETHSSQSAAAMNAPADSAPSGMALGFTTGAGYASTTLTQGVGGGEAMDECGLRYLLALKNYISLSESLPLEVRVKSLASSEFIWAFHSDAEMELLAALPCVQNDELAWSDLCSAGVGWWLRSSETLRRLMEKVGNVYFM